MTRARRRGRPTPAVAAGAEPLALPLQRLDPELAVPAYAHPGDAGLDLRAARTVTLDAGARALVPTGVAMAIPPGFAGLVVPRSGLALQHGVTVLNAPGLIDAGYRGELQVLLVNHDRARAVTVERGDRIAQLVLVPVGHVVPTLVDVLPVSDRGAGGFGSTGA